MFDTKTRLALALTASATMWSASTLAQVDLSATPAAPATYASEISLAEGTLVRTLTIVNGVTLEMPVGQPVNTERYLRVDLVGGEFAAVPALTLTVAGAGADVTTEALSGGGMGANDADVVFSISATTMPIAADTILTISNAGANLEIETDLTANTTATIAIYEGQTLAERNPSSFLGEAVSGILIDYASGLDVDFTPAAQVAEVNSNFLRLVGNLPSVDAAAISLGTVQVDVDSAVFGPDGEAIMLDDLNIADMAAASVVIAGDYSFATDSDGDIDNALVTLGTVASAMPALTASSGTFAVSDLMTAPLALWVTPGDEEAFLESTYVGTITFGVPVAGTGSAPRIVTGSFGAITRNGTTVDIPYITTFSGYNQRLIIVNRGAGAADYNISFTPEAGVTATATASASGVIAGSQTTVFRMTDLVTLVGTRTRTAGQITIDAPPANIDVATTQVNLSTASTDTVVLD